MMAHRRRGCVVLSLVLATSGASAEPPDPPRAAVAERTPLPARPPAGRLPVSSALVMETVTAALRAAGNAEMRRMLSSMAARARTSAALPELWVRAARSTDDSLRLSPTVDDPYHYTALGGAGTWLEARLAWHLDRLLFDRDEIAVERLRREHTEAMGRLIGKVTAALFAWQRAVLRMEDANAAEEDLAQAVVARAEAEATLDLLTAGWFGKRVTRGERGSGTGDRATGTTPR
jgi:hypothetical protein